MADLKILTAIEDEKSGQLVATFQSADVTMSEADFGGKKVKIYDDMGGEGEKTVTLDAAEVGLTDLSKVSHFIVDVMTPNSTEGYIVSVVVPCVDMAGSYGAPTLFTHAEWTIDGTTLTVQSPTTCMAYFMEEAGNLVFMTGVFDVEHAPAQPIDQTHNFVIGRIYAVYA